MVVTACFEDGFDPTNEPDKPTITYDATTLETPFYTAGNSGAPNIDWNGEQGSLSLTNSVEELDINTTTGVLNWSKLLAPGKHDIQVIASNSAGQTVVNMTLINQFQGVFTGTYSGSSFFELEFNEDGSLIVRANTPTDPDLASGTWTLNEDTIVANYTYEETMEQYSLKGTLSITNSDVTLSGNWFFEFDADPDKIGNTFETVLQ